MPRHSIAPVSSRRHAPARTERPTRRVPARSVAVALLAATTLVSACRPGGINATASGAEAVPARVRPNFPATWRFTPGREASFAEHGMVSSATQLASDAGTEIMRQGGNAADAAVAVGFALAVSYPVAGNIGGGGFMVVRMADGRTAALDFREVAPLASTRNMYLDANGDAGDRSRVGHLASGVPGSVAGMAEMVQRFGTMTLAQVMAPAIRLASEGFIVDSAFARSLRSDSAKVTRYAGAAVFYPTGSPLRAGERLRQPALARTLRAIARDGPSAFYEGWIADSTAAEMQRGGGIITTEDLRRYRAIWRDALQGTYRRYTIIGMPPASSGGTTMIEALNILETYPTLPPFESAAYKHLFAEAFRRAFVDRNTRLCDPAFCEVPVAELTSKAYARQLAASIDMDHASRSPAPAEVPTGLHTTHYSVVDGSGNAVSTTTTLNLGYGSGVFVPGAGFFMNDEMDDLAVAPGKPNAFGLVEGEQNAVAPGKRPLSSMSPTIVLDPAGRVLLVVGAAGGPTIITGTAQVILNVVDHRMTLADAMSAPRMHHQAWPDSIRYEPGGFSPAVVDSLRAMGHGVYSAGALTTVHGIMRVRGGWQGFPEPRAATGAAVGY